MHKRAYAHDKRTEIKEGQERRAEPRVPTSLIGEVAYRATALSGPYGVS